jgi:hypothetical protein
MHVANNEMFRLRDKVEEDYEIVEIGERKSKLIVVHNLFEYPDDVYNFIQTHPIELNKSYDPDYNYEGPNPENITPGYIGYIGIEARPIRRFINWGSSTIFKDPTYYKDIKLRINAFQSGIVGPKKANYPHADSIGTPYSATIYMDKKNLGGTGFYRFKNGMEEFPLSGYYLPEVKEYYDWLNDWRLLGEAEVDTIDNDENWTMYHVVPMEWNKAVIYEAGLFHSPIIKPGMYTGDEYRTSINIFTMVN